MESKELRLGNLVMFEGNIVKIDGIQPTWVWFDDMSSHSMYGIEPIPLTEEWLTEKLGLEKVREYFTINNEFEVFKNNDGFYTHVNCGNITLNHVHQLQNLYFAITSEELTISE